MISIIVEKEMRKQKDVWTPSRIRRHFLKVASFDASAAFFLKPNFHPLYFCLLSSENVYHVSTHEMSGGERGNPRNHQRFPLLFWTCAANLTLAWAHNVRYVEGFCSFFVGERNNFLSKCALLVYPVENVTSSTLKSKALSCRYLGVLY